MSKQAKIKTKSIKIASVMVVSNELQPQDMSRPRKNASESIIIKNTNNKIIKLLASSIRNPLTKQKPNRNSNQGSIKARDVSRNESPKYDENW